MKTLQELMEGTVVSSDYKISKTGRKYKAHRKMIEGVNPYGVDVDEATDKVVKDKTGKVISWMHAGDWKKATKKDPAGKVTNLSDKARRKTASMTAEEAELDEARGRPAGAATLAKRAAAAAKPKEDDDESEQYDKDSGVEADQHIHVQLKKAIDSTEKPFEISFRNNKKHKVSSAVAKDILTATEKLKPEHRKQVHDQIHQSYDNLMGVHKMIKSV